MDPAIYGDPAVRNAARNGDPIALDSLFARHLPPLMAFLRSRAGGHVIRKESLRDLAQSVCREVLADWDDFEFRDEGAFRNWLYLHATRKILNRQRYFQSAMRDAARERPLEAGPGADADDRMLVDCYASLPSPSQHAGAREELQELEQAVEQLPENQRDAVMLTRILGLDYATVATQLQMTESAVRGLVARGLARLSSLLDPPA